MSESKKITLTSSDGERFEVDEAVAREFEIVAHMIEDGCVNGTIPIANVASMYLAKVIEYCKKHVEAAAVEGNEEMKTGAAEGNEDAKAGAVEGNEEAKIDLKKWDEEFVKSLEEDMQFPLILAANYLNIRGLIDLLCQKVADDIKDLQIEEVRERFGIKNDYTPEEEEAVRKENEWAFKP